MQKALKIYQKRLTNLSSRNRSLLLLRLLKSQFIDLHQFDYLENSPSFQLIEELVAQKNSIKLCSSVDSRDQHSNAISQQLRKIYRADQFIFEEQGARDLYAGYPFVQGRLLDDTLVRCPLLFFPVSLQIKQNRWLLSFRKDVGITFNKSFLLAFSHYNQVNFEEKFLEHDFSGSATDSQEFRTELYRLLEGSPLELNFGQQTFEDLLEDFRNFTRPEFLEFTETGRLKLSQEAVLGIFPQAGSYLMPDYAYLLQNSKTRDLEDFFMSSEEMMNDPGVHGTVVSKAAKEEELVLPYPADGSQEQAIKAIKSGGSLVVQGPPGSGKSQLICNLVADYIARGKNVLLVCQKKAALDVVYKRLGEKGFSEFAALVHDFKNDRRDIYEKISHLIGQLDNFQRENNSLDAIYLERRFLKISREIDQVTEELEEFRQALFHSSECGISVKELYLTSNLNLDGVNLRREYEHFHFARYDDYMQRFRRFISYQVLLDSPTHPWASRVPFGKFDLGAYQKIREMIPEVRPAFEQHVARASGLLGISPTLEEFDWIHDRREDFYRLLELLQNDTVFRYFKQGLRYKLPDYLWLANRKKNLLSSFGTEGIENSLDKHEIGQVQEILQRALLAQNTWYRKVLWRLFSKDRGRVSHLLKKNKLEEHPRPLEMLMRKLDNRMNLEHHLSTLAQYKWLMDTPAELNMSVLHEWIDLHLQALDARRIYDSLRNGIRYLELQDFSWDEMNLKLKEMLQVVASMQQQRQQWQQYLSGKQITALLEESLLPKTLEQSLERDFDALVAFDQLKNEMLPHEQSVLNKFTEKFGKLHAEETPAAIDNSIRIAWINHIETKYPVLRTVSTERLPGLEARLQELVTEKQQLSQQIALVKMRERTYSEVEFNRLNNMVTYRDLKHQVSKKRNIWPLRKLIASFSHELLNLLPCWMASPESVSAIFPMEEFFDLVIFDEASQCFAEKGIPAMYRGKQVAITGDDQQLAPFDLYTPRWEEELEDEPALEVDSLLDLGKRYLRQIPLTGHYRSKSLELIGFSNQHFYEGRLQLVPHYHEFVKAGPAIEYLRVDGVWEQNRNQAEAEKVVEKVTSLIVEGIDNIGVITFNYKQQQLVQDLLEESGINLPEALFVKNIENVQGDEREVIIFSVGYAPSPSGKMRVQFGSLNAARGENRLNVAVTRARSKVVVVTSILPSQLKVEQAKNEGPRLLKAWLNYALQVSEHRFVPLPPAASGYSAGWYLVNKLKDLVEARQIATGQQIPFADLAVQANGQKSLLLTDDNGYFQSSSAREVHAFQPMQLASKGWRFRRFYSRHFWKNHSGFVKDFQRFVLPPPPPENQRPE